VAYGGIDADQRGLGEALPPEVFQEGLGHRDEPFVRPVVPVDLVVEGEEAVPIATLGVEGSLGLAGHFGDEVELGQVGQRVLDGLDGGWKLWDRFDGTIRAVSGIRYSEKAGESGP
jgi:hypothetical protein